jgi:PAS domain S-box-containing protein
MWILPGFYEKYTGLSETPRIDFPTLVAMFVSPPTQNEVQRLGLLREHTVLETPSEPGFDDIVALAARSCSAPIALIAFVDSGRLWFRSRFGCELTEAPLTGSFCEYAIEQPADLILVPDTGKDARFMTDPLVSGRHAVRFYAGVQLRIGGQIVGILCVMDQKSRSLLPHQQETLRALARQVVNQLELRRALAAVSESEERYRSIFKQNPTPLFVFECETLRYLAVNDAAVTRYGYTEKEFLEMTLLDLRPAEDHARLKREVANTQSGFVAVGRWRHRRKDGTILPVEIHAHNVVFGGRNARIASAIDVTEQDRVMAAFRTSEARYRALSESAPLGIFECDAQGNTTYCNAALLAIVGRTREEILGTGWLEAIHAEDRASVVAETKRCLPAGLTSNLEYRVLRPDGTMRWVHLLASPQQRDEEGHVSSFVGTLEDITEERVSEVAMLESEERYRKLLLLSPDAHFVLLDDRIALVNEAFCRLLGAAEPAELIGRSLFHVVHPAYHAEIKQRQQQALAGETAPPLEQKFVRLDGSTVDVEATAAAVTIDFHGRREVQIIARDITARKAAEIAVRESEERFKLVARAVSDVVWDWDIAAKSVWRSDSYATIFGLSSSGANAPSEAWSTRIHPSDRERVIGGLRRALASRAATWVEEYRFRRPDGSYAYVQDRGHIMRDANGRAYRMVGGMSDLTERKKLEQQYLRAQRTESIGTLAGGIAHDLNNVLAPILMSIDLLRLYADDDDRQLRLLDTIQSSTVRGADLVRQVLTFARGLDGQRVTIDLRHLLREIERIIQETFPRKIRIVSNVQGGIWPIVGDPTQIHQVLLNLSVNARDAMAETGVLTLSANNQVIDEAFVANTPEAKIGSHVVLTVADTGTGIPVEIRDRIFEPFFTTKEIGRGTGLGLATVHAIVKSHGGFVTVQSEVGAGTTFQVYLPADPALRPAVQKNSSGEPARGRGERILVIDDEASIRQITQQTLEQFGYRVDTAADGADAVSIYSKHVNEIGLVLTDMMMPVMDGHATIQVLMRLNPGIKIIAASGLNANENVAKAASLGVTDFLAKPYTSETMLKLIREVLDRPAKPAS